MQTIQEGDGIVKNHFAVKLLIALIGGAAAGFILSEIIGIAGWLIFGKAIGIKFLPVILPIVCAGVALIFMPNAKIQQERGTK